ncbi:DOMON domain-containing protein [Aureococcus anophagefferens]|uniref:DOMON domain-containing protein n=1 Tax=Aureococcus anophagefferens TaxID=44056 RepID=A0ABR1GF28_AURAN
MTLLRLVVAFGALSSANSYATELRCRSFAVGDVIMRRAAVRSDDTYLRLTDATGAVVACGSAVDAGATLTATLYQNDAALEFESHDVEYLIDARSGAAFVGGVCGGFENVASRSRNAPATFVVPAAGTTTLEGCHATGYRTVYVTEPCDVVPRDGEPVGRARRRRADGGADAPRDAPPDGGAWVSLGWGDGSMTGTECVIAEGPDGGPAKYDITSYKKSGIGAMAAQTLTDTATMVEDDAYVVEFTKLIEEAGEQTVGADQFIWSYGSRSLGFHGDDVGALTLDLETCAFSIKEIEGVSSRAIRAHGGLLLVAFAALMPSALVAAKSRFVLAPGPLWLKIHIACNVAALILAVAGVAVAASAIDRADNGEHLRGRHPKIGVGVMAAVGAMVLMGFARPGKDAPKRVYFNYVHTGLGYAAVVLAAAATRSGISKAADLGHVADDRPWFTAQSAMLGVALAAWLVVAAAGVQKRRDAKPAAAAAVDGADGKGPARVDEEEEAGEAPAP